MNLETSLPLFYNSVLVFSRFQIQVSALKEKVATETGVPVAQQRLIFRGKALMDDHLLSEYRILIY